MSRSAGAGRGPRLPRRPARLGAAGVAMAAGLGLIATAAPASAATGSFASPGADGVIYDGVSQGKTSVTLTASEAYSAGESGTATLTVADPRHGQNPKDGCSWSTSKDYSGFDQLTGLIPQAGSVTLTLNIDLTKSTYPTSCSSTYAGQLPVNGTWTGTLTGSGTTAPATRTFVVAIKPAAPTGLSGTSPGPLQETIGWVRNPELDTHLYEILDGGGASLGSFPANQACNSMTCSATVTASGSGSQSFQVEAFRRSAPTSEVNDPSTTGDLTAKSAAATFTVQAAAPAVTPSPAAGAGSSGTGSAGGGSTGTTGSGTTGSGATGTGPGGASSAPKASVTGKVSTESSAKKGQSAAPVAPTAPSSGALALGHTVSKGQAAKLGALFENFPPPAGTGKLPPLPVLASSVPTAPAAADPADGEPTDQGTFKRKLGYAPQSTTTAITTTTVPLSSVADALGVSPLGLWRSVAGSLLLLLGAAHVRRFAKAPID